MLRTATKPERPSPGHRIFLTAYWKDREGGASGRETLPISLSVPWTDLITPSQLQNHRALLHFRSVGPDHLALDHISVGAIHVSHGGKSGDAGWDQPDRTADLLDNGIKELHALAGLEEDLWQKY